MDPRLERTVQDEKDIKYIWICSGCNAISKTAEEIKPEQCPDCGAPNNYIDRYYVF